MLNALIRASLHNRSLVLGLALFVLGVSAARLRDVPVEVFPELNAPTVTILTEAPGFSSDEVERAVTFPVETSLNGLIGLRRLRSSSTLGLSMVWAEFDFGTDIYRNRQLVSERLATAREALPDTVHAPEMAPISSIAGEVLLLGLSSRDGSTSPLELRRFAEFELKPRLLAVRGVAQVSALGGELPEYQVRVRSDDLQRYGLTLADVERAAGAAHAPAGGGYLPDVDGRELPLRPGTRLKTIDDLGSTIVGNWRGAPITLDQVASVGLAGAPKRGEGSSSGRDAVVVSVKRTPEANTLSLTDRVDAALDDIEAALPRDVVLEREVFRQATFIERAVDNVTVALRDAAIFVLIVLVMFLLNVRTTLITLTALPFSLGATLLVLEALGQTVNVMTLGGIAVAVGSLVDDAIVDVENVFRRLRENAARSESERRPTLKVVYEASVEVRQAILLATAVIVLVFVPLFFLDGIEGRFFRPLGLAYILSLAASLIVAMTVTPVLCWLLLRKIGASGETSDPKLVRVLKGAYRRGLEIALRRPIAILATATALLVGSAGLFSTFGSSFLPEFGEGSYTVFVNAEPGSSLAESNRVAGRIETRIAGIEGVSAVTRKTGRAENDEHVEPPSASEIEVRLLEDADREAVLRKLTALGRTTPGVSIQIGAPIAHRLSHILSGTPAAIAIKIFGDDLDELRHLAEEIGEALEDTPGVRDLVANREVMTDTVPIDFDRRALARFGLTPADAAKQLETGFLGRKVGVVNEGSTRIDIVVRLDEQARQKTSDVGAFVLRSPTGARVPVSSVADVYEAPASGLITRENVRRKAVVSCNVAEGENLGDLVARIRTIVDPLIAEHAAEGSGVFVEYGGQFEAQEQASRRILQASIGVLALIYLLLHGSFGSWRPAVLILSNLPLALVGGAVALFLADSANPIANFTALFGSGEYIAPVVSISSLVGFIGLAGIACRNGLLLISHIESLIKEGLAPAEAIRRGSQERLVPILMTALSSGLALLPLVFAKGEIGSELQVPIAVVILGGLVSSTLLNLFVVPVGYQWFGRKRQLAED